VKPASQSKAAGETSPSRSLIFAEDICQELMAKEFGGRAALELIALRAA
jgi:hypothetical protein